MNKTLSTFIGLHRYFRYFRYLFYKENAQPVYLVHFLTNRCNAKCAHCLRYGVRQAADKELSIREIEQLTRHLGNVYSVTLTGGEALLRCDINDIAKAYLENSNIRTLQILSNGSLADRIAAVARDLAPRFPDKMISFELSLDGLGAQHDELRGFPGLFEKVIQSYRRVKVLQKKYSNLKVGFNITVTAANQGNIIKLYRYLVGELGSDLLKATLVRGEIEHENLKSLNLEYYQTLCREMEKRPRMREPLPIAQDLLSSLIQIQDVKARQRVIDTVTGSKYIAPCYAGRLSGVIFADGEVGPCELRRQKFGNLRDHDYRILSVWKTQRAAEIRRTIHDTKCYCTYECAMLCNILFNPSYLCSLLNKTANLWLSKRSV